MGVVDPSIGFTPIDAIAMAVLLALDDDGDEDDCGDDDEDDGGDDGGDDALNFWRCEVTREDDPF